MQGHDIDWHGVSFPVQLWPGTVEGSWQVKSGEEILEFSSALNLLRWLEGLSHRGAPPAGLR